MCRDGSIERPTCQVADRRRDEAERVLVGRHILAIRAWHRGMHMMATQGGMHCMHTAVPTFTAGLSAQQRASAGAGLAESGAAVDEAALRGPSSHKRHQNLDSRLPQPAPPLSPDLRACPVLANTRSPFLNCGGGLQKRAALLGT